jgi:hypothetical protein
VERSDERVTDTEAEYTELFEETEEEIVETITRTETSDSQVKPDTAVSEAEATAGNPEEREIVTVNNEADIDDKPAAGGAEEESAAVQNQKGTHQTDEATGIGSSEEEAGSKNDEQSAASAESDAGDEKVRQDQQDNNVEHPVMQNEIQETGISETVERTDTESEAGKDTAKETEAPQDVTEDSLVAAEDETNDTGESAPGAFTTNGEDSMRDELSPVNKESMEHTTESDGTFDDPLGNGIPDEEGEPAASDVIETDEKPRDTAIVDESEENEKETDSAVVEMDKTDMEELEKSASGENVAEELAASDLHKPIDATGKEGEELLESTSSTKDISETEEQPVEGVAVEEDKVSDADKPEENLNESMAAEPISADQDVREQTENQASSEVEIRDSIAANFIEAPSIAIDENEPVEELKLSEDNDAQAVLNESDEATVSDATKDQEVVLAAGADKVDPVYDDEEGERSMINMAAEERDTDDHLLPNVNKADDQNAAEPQEANEEIKNSEIDITSDACEHRDDTTAANANDNDAMIEESRAAEVIETEREAYELQPGDESIQEATAPEITGSVEQAEDNATDAGEATKEIDDTAASDEGQMLNEGEEAVTADVIAAKMSAESHDLDNEATDQLLEGRIDEVAEQKAAAEVETEDTKTDEALALAADEANEEEAVIDDNNEKQEELANVNGGDNNTAATDADESAEEPNGSEPEEGSADTKTASEQPETQAAPTEGDLTEVTDASVEANERPEEVTEPSEDEKDIIKDEDSEQKAEPTAVGDDVSTAATPGENEQTEPTAPADEAVVEAKDSETFDEDEKTEPAAPVNETLSETPCKNEQTEPTAPADEAVTEAKDSETFDEDENTEPAAPVNETLNEAPGENEQTEPTAPADEAVTEAKDSETFDKDDKTEPTAPVNEMLSETPGENEQIEPMAPADETVTEAKDSETFDEDENTEPAAPVNETLNEAPGENEQTEPTAPADEAVTEAKDSETFDEDDKTEPTAPVNEMLSETPGENEQTEPTAPADEAVTEAKDSETFDEDDKTEPTASVNEMLSETPGENEQTEPTAPADEAVTEAKDSETFDEDDKTEPTAPVNEMLSETPGENEQTEPTAPADEAVTEAKDSETFDEDDKTEPTASVNEMLSETPGENEQTEPTAPADEAVTEAKDSETFDEDKKAESTASVKDELTEASVQPGKPASAIETEKDEFEDKAAETTKETEEPAAAGDREASETKDEASKVIAQPENTTDVDEMNAAADYSAPVEDESGTPETQPTFETIEGKLQQTDDAVSEQGPQDGCEANEKGEVITPGDQASSDTRSNELEGQKADDVNGLGQETEAGAEELSSDNSNTVGQESEANAKSTDEQVTLIDTIRTDQEEASVGAEKGSLPDSNACNDPVEPKKAEAVNDDNGPEPGERHDLPVEAVSDSLTDAEPVAINNDEAEEASGYLEVTDSHGVTDEQSEVSGVSEEKPKENIEVAEEAKETPDGETEANSGAASGEMIAATGAEFNQDPQSPSANEATVGAEDIVTPAVAETDSADNVDAAPENEIAIKPADHEELEETKVDNEPDADAERTVPTTDDVNAAITGSNLESDVVNVADADSTQKDPEEANTEQNIAHATEELNEPESSNADGLNHHEKGEETSPINLASEETDLTSTVSPNEAETNEMAKDERTEEEDRTKGETHCATEIDAECEESSNQKANDANAESKASEINEEQQPADKPDTIIDTESPSIQAGDVNESNENLEDAKQGEENMVNKDSPTADEGSVQEKVISVADGASEEAAENTTAEEAQDSEKEDSVNVVPVESNEQPATSEETQDVTSTYSEQQPVPTIENEQGESRIDDCGESQPAIDITPYVANQKDVELSGIELSATQVIKFDQHCL